MSLLQPEARSFPTWTELRISFGKEDTSGTSSCLKLIGALSLKRLGDQLRFVIRVSNSYNISMKNSKRLGHNMGQSENGVIVWCFGRFSDNYCTEIYSFGSLYHGTCGRSRRLCSRFGSRLLNLDSISKRC